MFTLKTAKGLEGYQKQQDDAQRAKDMEGYDDALRQSGLNVFVEGDPRSLPNVTPDSPKYDFEAAYLNKVPFKSKEQGGSDLPNKFMAKPYVAGRNIRTGEVVERRNDPDGFGEVGAREFGNSFTNSVMGLAPEAADGVLHLAFEHAQNGGQRDDFDVPAPDEMVDTAWSVVEDAQSIYGITNALHTDAEALEAEPPTENAGQAAERPKKLKTEELFAVDGWLDNARVVAEYMGGTADSDEELHKAAVEEMALTASSFWKMGTLIYEIETGKMPPEVAESLLFMVDHYEQLTMLDWDVAKGTLVGIGTDPGTYLLGGAGGVAAKLLGRQTIMQAFKNRLMASAGGKMTAAAGPGALIGGIEGGAFMGQYEAYMQSVRQEQRDWGRMASEGGWGAVAGVLIGAPFGVAFSKSGREAGKDYFAEVGRRIAETNLMDSGGTPAAQRGSFSWRDITGTSKPQLPPNSTDFGVRMADGGKAHGEYYSRMARLVAGDDGAWASAFGNKPVDPQRAIDMMTVWQQRGFAGKETFSADELQNTATIEFLQEKIALGEKVSRFEIEDWLYATAPRVNSLVSGQSDFMDAGSKYYLPLGQQRRLHEETVGAVADRAFIVRGGNVTPEAQAAAQEVNQQTKQYESSYAAWLDSLTEDLLNDALDLSDPIVMNRITPPQVPQALKDAAPDHAEIIEATRSKAIKDFKAGNYGDLVSTGFPEYLPPNQGEVTVTNPFTKETKVYPDLRAARVGMDAQARQLTAGMSKEEQINLVRGLDEQRLLAPTRWGSENVMGHTGGGRISMTITGGDNRNNYREMRLFVPHDPLSAGAIAEDLNWDLSKPELAKRVERIQQYQRMNLPEKSFNENVHYPLEHNRFAHARLQDLYLPDGTEVLAVNEMQSDLAQRSLQTPRFGPSAADQLPENFAAFKQKAEELGLTPDQIEQVERSASGRLPDDFDDFAGDAQPMTVASMMENLAIEDTDVAAKISREVKKLFDKLPEADAPSWQPTAGWQMMTLNRILQQAVQDGKSAVALPIDKNMIARVEAWDADAAKKNQGVVNFYQQMLPRMIKKDKKFIERWGITMEELPVQADPAGNEKYETMLILRIGDPSPKPRAMYSAAPGAIVGAEGGKMLTDDDETDEGM